MFGGRDDRNGFGSRNGDEEKNEMRDARGDHIRGDGLESGLGRAGNLPVWQWLCVVAFWGAVYGLYVLFG